MQRATTNKETGPTDADLQSYRNGARLTTVFAAIAFAVVSLLLWKAEAPSTLPPHSRRHLETGTRTGAGPSGSSEVQVRIDAEGAHGDMNATKEETSGKITTNKETVEGYAESGLPQCFSSPEADPSEGFWRSSPGGIDDSPASRLDWKPSAPWFFKTCRDNWKKQHPEKVDVQPYWTWEAVKCQLDNVSDSKFCHVMKARKGLLLVGDSLTGIFANTLLAVLAAKRVRFNGNTARDEWSACGGTLPVLFVRNDYLDTGVEPFDEDKCRNADRIPQDNTMCHIFADDHTLSRFDTLVVNSGTHPRPDKQYAAGMKAAAGVLSSSMERLHGDDALLVVRNTVPGHWGCSERMFNGPVDTEVALGLVNGAPPGYQWQTFHTQNALLEDAFSPDIGWNLLDAYTPTLLRPDSHPGGEVGKEDCLHYCIPGPIDHWVRLLYNIMLAVAVPLRGEEQREGES